MDRLEAHAKSLAAAQVIGKAAPDQGALPRRLRHNLQALKENFIALARAANAGRPVTSAGEWFLDNFHIVEEQARNVQRDLPASFYRELPKLREGHLRGYPRVYGIAWAVVAHSDSAFDGERLEKFVEAYQQVTPLKIGELWAIAITLRLVLVENLRRLTDIVVHRISDAQRGATMADEMLSLPPGRARSRLKALELAPALLTVLEQRLREEGAAGDQILRVVERSLLDEGMSSTALIQKEYQDQSADDVSVRNIINAMRLVSNLDWADFFEDVSLVDRALADGTNFVQVDFATRDRYRRAVERIARRSQMDERQVAGAAIDLVRGAAARPPRERDIGYYLIAQGRRSLERRARYRPTTPERLARWAAITGLWGYVTAIAAVTSGLLACLLATVLALGVDPTLMPLLGLIAVIPVSDLALAIVNRAVTKRWQPEILPALSLKHGLEADVATILVMPTLLGRPDSIAEQIERLEIHYLSNADAEMRFVLLSDWMDSDEPENDEDRLRLDLAQGMIAELNRRHPQTPPLFLMLHRARRFNPRQGKWMGWERKRGKLHELNRLLRGASDTSFLDWQNAQAELGPGIRFVITLDADTQIPRGAARRLIGKMAHPLNWPVFDGKTGCVTAGHGILQPRVTPSLPIGSESSLFQWAFSGPNGLDPYAFAVSDVYQDLFGEGSFVGKGIYDIDAFEKAIENRIPENAILSHDLLEGSLARAALVSDVELVEEFPSRYDVEVARQHRWMRGDWQLLPWIFGSWCGGRGAIGNAPVPVLGRWKMLDNLRRSLGAPAMLLSLLVGWQLPSYAAWAWTFALIAVLALPALLPILAGVIPRQSGYSMRSHARNLARDGFLASTQIIFNITFIARLAFLALDAILRTLFRLFISRKYLLEWVTFAQSAYSRREGFSGTALQLVGSTTFVLAVAAAVGSRHLENLVMAVPFLLLWGGSPLLARWASRPPRAEPHLDMSDADRLALRLAARRTWAFFERFVTAEENMLPPDNFQEDPAPLIAHRTSPTNIGAYLCSVVAARDFGWIGTVETVERIEQTLATLRKLDRYRGHFLNWYDTRSLSALDPRYISSVDSGNLLGALIAIKNACEQIVRNPRRDSVMAGQEDSLAALAEDCELLPRGESRRLAAERVAALRRGLAARPVRDAAGLQALRQEAAGLVDGLPPDAPGRLPYFAHALLATIDSHLRDFASDPADAGWQEKLHALAQDCSQLAREMDFTFLFDQRRQLLVIGYRLDDHTLDTNAYDLLASEARLASFCAIAKGDVPTKHWFRLGRTLTPLGLIPALQSWSGSMFEYLMPTLLMHEPKGSLLNLSNRAAVIHQIRYLAHRAIPWGISESQYNARDRDQNYQYSAFGVPDLGIKRGLGENLVIAPYASGLAAMMDPVRARSNLDALTRLGALGDFGWYEALDYTSARLPEGAGHALIRSYMAHHQGMMIVALANVLHDGAIRELFHAEPMVKAAELLLQERMPRDVSVARMPPSLATGAITFHKANGRPPRRITNAATIVPRTHLLSNANYSLMVSAAGGGFSRWRGIAINRWREDTTRDNWGSFIYLRDLRSGKVWSAAHQPTGVAADAYEAQFSEDRAVFKREDGSLVTTTEIYVSPEDDSEVRRVTITNNGSRVREVEITSYMELALARPSDDMAHPAFSKLFVQTEYLRDTGALIASRRKRDAAEPSVWAAHLSVVDGESVGDVQYETDRYRFLTRGKTARDAAAITEDWPLSNTAGAVLDPCFSLRRRVQVARGESVSIAFWTMVADSRDGLLDLIDRHHDGAAFERAATLAATFGRSQLHHLGISGEEQNAFQLLAGFMLYPDNSLRARPDVLEHARPASAVLWPLGISGDLPVMVARLSEDAHLPLARQLIKARAYWCAKGMASDLVLLNERPASYSQDLQKALEIIVNGGERAPDDCLGHVVVARGDLLGEENMLALRAAARVSLNGSRGLLEAQLASLVAEETAPTPAAVFEPSVREAAMPAQPDIMSKLRYFNGYGGFTPDGREYVVVARGGKSTPAPWINVIANPDFGFQISAEGAGFCWSGNSQQNQVTPWSNDPVTNESGDFLYLKDLESGEVWSPVSSPAAHPQCLYTCAHGQGYSRFGCTGAGLETEVLYLSPLKDSVRIARLTVRNTGSKARRLSVTACALWALGPTRANVPPLAHTWCDDATDALMARNPVSNDFSARVGFLDMQGRQDAWTCDRREFFGRNGGPHAPAALTGNAALSGRAGPGLDPCAVLQSEMDLAPGQEKELVILLGQGRDADDAKALILRYRTVDVAQLLAEVTGFWDRTLGTLEVRTPDPAMNLLTNRWLLYQTLSCRMWGRAGFYQVSGAYGFRDQLQDSMALCLSQPGLARQQILRAAGRQFLEGDVQHWWLPESGKGVRTRISDDKSWLGYVTAHYLETTGDDSILDEKLAFLTGPPVPEDKHDLFIEPGVSDVGASLYEHCARALDASLAVGVHNLPLMGTGDWNDGMNRVGEGGKGESVWLGWFLYTTLTRFLPIAERRKDSERAGRWLIHRDILRQGLEEHGWDGAWYRRAFFDDGFALGSAANRECRIDSIAQSWSVISGVAPPDKARRAMEAADKYLVRANEQIMTLFTPPFVSSQHDPGYIKGYPAGVRENGGQYTHGVLWSIIAHCLLGDGDRAAELFAMLNPINHARSRTQADRYRVEPYVACGDVYSVGPLAGRGGWSWYSGSAAWMYRTAIEYILGIRRQGDVLVIDPVIPRQWQGFDATLTCDGTVYDIAIYNPLRMNRGVVSIELDGQRLPPKTWPRLTPNSGRRKIQVTLGREEPPA